MGLSFEPDDRLSALTGWMLSSEVRGVVGVLTSLPGVPRRSVTIALVSEIIALVNSAGPSTSIFIIGSRMTGLARATASRQAPRLASWNAMSEESTGWYWPSLIVTRIPLTG